MHAVTYRFTTKERKEEKKRPETNHVMLHHDIWTAGIHEEHVVLVRWGLVGSTTKEDEEDEGRSAIMMYYSPIADVLIILYLPCNPPPCHTDK